MHENSVGLSSTTNPKPKGQPSISLPAQANLTSKPLRCLALRTRTCICTCTSIIIYVVLSTYIIILGPTPVFHCCKLKNKYATLDRMLHIGPKDKGRV